MRCDGLVECTWMCGVHAFSKFHRDMLLVLDCRGYDKRFYTAPEVALLVPRIEDPPKWKQGAWKFIEGNPVTREKHEAIVQMIGQMNKGIETLKDLSSR
jgi:hypothetical protein